VSSANATSASLEGSREECMMAEAVKNLFALGSDAVERTQRRPAVVIGLGTVSASAAVEDKFLADCRL
jgi:hypothetical protein